MSIEKLINWRQVSKIVSKSKSETAIQMYSCPKKYHEPIDALLLALQIWHNQYIKGNHPQVKLTVEEIKQKLDSIKWESTQ